MELVQPNRPLYWAEIIYAVQEALQGVPDVFCVGGMVRDAYRDHPFKDIDLTCATDGRKIARRLASAFGGAYYTLDEKRLIGRAIVEFQGERYVIDVSQFRGANLLEDLQGRDFSINSMAVPLETDLKGIYDPLGGMADWGNKILRRCSPSAIQSDPIRALRAVRLCLQFDLQIEPNTRQDLKTWGKNITQTSPERIREEFFAILGGKKIRSALMILDSLGLLELILPERSLLSPVEWTHTLVRMDKLNTLAKVISPRRDDNVAANAEFGTYVYLLDRFRGISQAHLNSTYPEGRKEESLLYFTALLLNPSISLALAKKRALELHLSNDELKRLSDTLSFFQATAALFQESQLDATAVYRFWATLGDSGFNTIWLTLVDYLARQGVILSTAEWTHHLDIAAQLLDGYSIAKDASALVTGDDLMATFSLPPGPLIGELLAILREANALGQIQSPQEALSLAQEILEDPNLNKL